MDWLADGSVGAATGRQTGLAFASAGESVSWRTVGEIPNARAGAGGSLATVGVRSGISGPTAGAVAGLALASVMLIGLLPHLTHMHLGEPFWKGTDSCLSNWSSKHCDKNCSPVSSPSGLTSGNKSVLRPWSLHIWLIAARSLLL